MCRLASGKTLGEYSLKSITSILTPGSAGSVLNQVNWEGTATGFGALFGTATLVGSNKGGSFSWCSTVPRKDSRVAAQGYGAFFTSEEARTL